MTSLVLQHQSDLKRICQEQGISYLGVFGSQSRGDVKPNSDVDFLVEFKHTPGLISFIRTKHLFEDVLGRKVDLVTKNNISKILEPYINQDLQTLHG